MKSTFILAVSIISFLFSPFSSGKDIIATVAGKQVISISWTYSGHGYYKVVNAVECDTYDGNTSLEVFYNNNSLGCCGSKVILPLKDEFTKGTSTSVTVINNSAVLSSTVFITAVDHYSLPFDKSIDEYMGTASYKVVPKKSVIKATVADSVDFSALNSGATESKLLIFPSSTLGTVTVKPSMPNNKMGEIQDNQNKNTINYTVDGGAWDDKAGGWVIKDGLEHELVINPQKLKLAPGQYSGAVTVTLASE